MQKQKIEGKQNLDLRGFPLKYTLRKKKKKGGYKFTKMLFEITEFCHPLKALLPALCKQFFQTCGFIQEENLHLKEEAGYLIVYERKKISRY